MKIKLMLTVAIILSTSGWVFAADEQPTSLGDSEIHIFDLTIKNGVYSLKNKVNISNNKGYDNQPYFTENSKSVLFVSMRDGKQTDVFEYNIKHKSTKQLTDTPHSEYSPKTIGDTGNVSFVSEGFNPYQSVWQLDRISNKQSWLLNSKEPVGYYQHNESTGDVLFWSRYGFNVQYLNLKRNDSRFVSGNAIPSSPQQIPNGERFSFVHRQSNGEVWIKAFDPKDYSITPLAPIYNDNYDYAWAPNGDILRLDNNRLSVWPAKNKEKQWQAGQDLGEEFKGKIGRLSISANGKSIALVENR
jgi:hypothetical protein